MSPKSQLKQFIAETVRAALEAQSGPRQAYRSARRPGAYATRIHESYGADFEGPGLVVTGRTPNDNNNIKDVIEDHQFIAYWNAREGYWFFPEEPETLDALELELSATFDTFGIDARFESQE